MLKLFADNLLPVFLAAGAGWLLAARTRLDPRPVTHVAFFILAPCFVYDALVNGEVGGAAMVRTVVFATAVLGVVALAVGLLVWRLDWPRPMRAAIVLVVLLPNAGNYGISVCHFAFGDEGLAYGTLFFVTSSVLTFTVGVLVASAGRASLASAIAGLVRVPAVCAIVLAAGTMATGVRAPYPVERTVGLLAEACIPVFLIILGMQLRGRGLRGPYRPLALACGARLVGGALAGLLLVGPIGLEGAARQAGVLQSGMPSAVITIILAAEYDTEPGFVTSAVVVSTLLSPLTLTPLLAYLTG